MGETAKSLYQSLYGAWFRLDQVLLASYDRDRRTFIMTIAISIRTGSAVVFAADSKLTTRGIVGLEEDGTPRWQIQTYRKLPRPRW